MESRGGAGAAGNFARKGAGAHLPAVGAGLDLARAGRRDM